MQIIIPMSGFGERFRRAGYHVPKPLIEIDGKPIIAHIIDMFPNERDFLFICNQEHLGNLDYQMESVLRALCPSGKIVGIEQHRLGPIYAVQKVAHLIDPSRPALVNYCDFSCYWDWHHFKDFVAKTACSGAIPAYKGFHPHSLGHTNYAYIREEEGWAQDIQEKQPFTDNRLNEFASSGTYYFSSGHLMCEAFKATIERDLNIGGEYYVSLAYKQLFADNLPVAIYPLQHFMQWGTPEDVAEYKGWSSAFRHLIAPGHDVPSLPQGSLIVPMAGLGQRFVNEGYGLTKPLIPVSGKPMVCQATHDLPAALHHVFVLRSDMAGYEDISNQLMLLYPDAIIETISETTQGQACTALIGLDVLERKIEPILKDPITVGACDNGALYDAHAFQRLIDDRDVDVIVWGVRGHAHAVRNPSMFGWIQSKDGVIQTISVKTPLDCPATDPIILGTFTFRRAADFRKIIDHLIARDGRINGEFYIDEAINDAISLGMRCVLFEVDHFLCWGTPNDLRTYEYWQSCFHKWPSHPYRLEQDLRVDAQSVPLLEVRYQKIIPALPKNKPS